MLLLTALWRVKKDYSFFFSVFVSLWEYQKSQESARSCALSQPIWACLFNCCQNPPDYRNEYPNCTWPSRIKHVVSYFTSRHRPSSLDFLVTIGTWVPDKPNVLISILQRSAGLCRRQEELSVPSWHPGYRPSCRLSYWPGNISPVMFWGSGPFLCCVLQKSGVRREEGFVLLMWAELSSHFPSQIPSQDMFLLHPRSPRFKQSYSFPECVWPDAWLLSVV